VSSTREVELTSLDRVLFPAADFTKGDVVEYYRRVAPVLLPHLAGRPLTLGRFPAGIDARGFAPTECKARPAWMRTQPVRLLSGAIRNYCVVEDLPSLLWVANLGTIELHGFPTGLVLDLDPGPAADVLDCGRVALRIRDLLAESGVEAAAKTTGSRGLHVHAPLELARAAETGRTLGDRLALEDPDSVTANLDPAARGGRVLVDWRQSNPRMLTIIPYSLRATDHPRVATPVTWSEIESAVAARQAARLSFSPGQVIGALRTPRRPDARGGAALIAGTQGARRQL
jgi:bifunctional non-homologous end joining protein LigD